MIIRNKKNCHKNWNSCPQIGEEKPTCCLGEKITLHSNARSARQHTHLLQEIRAMPRPIARKTRKSLSPAAAAHIPIGAAMTDNGSPRHLLPCSIGPINSSNYLIFQISTYMLNPRTHILPFQKQDQCDTQFLFLIKVFHLQNLDNYSLNNNNNNNVKSTKQTTEKKKF